MGKYKNIKDDDVIWFLEFDSYLDDLINAIIKETKISEGYIVIYDDVGIECFDNKQDALKCYQALLEKDEIEYVLIYKYDSEVDDYNR